MNAQMIIDILGLVPHDKEGGYFSEVYRSEGIIPACILSKEYSGNRNICTSIYYLLTPETFSSMHRLRSDEIFHLYMGGPVEMLMLMQDGTYDIVTIGTDLKNGERPQVLVPAGVWQGCCLKNGATYALMGTTVAPGFDFDDYEQGDHSLIESYPNCAEMIRKLTKK